MNAIDRGLRGYVLIADDASRYGYAVTFLVVSVIALVGAAAVGWLVRRPRVTTASPPPPAPQPVAPPSPTG